MMFNIFFFIAAISVFPCFGVQFWEEASINFHALTYETNHLWNKQGKVISSHNHFKKWEVDLCFECMPTCNDIFAIRGLYDRIEEEMDGNTNGFGDPEISWVRRVLNCSSSSVLGRFLMIVPAGKEKASLRYGRFGAQIDMIYSSCMNLWNIQIDSLLGIGYRIYQGFPSDQVRAFLELNSQIYGNLYWLSYISLEYGVFNGKRKEHFNQILFNPNYRLLKVQFSLVGYITEWMYFDIGYFEHIWGENVGNSGGWIGGFGYIF
jgi:hypothetical protein